MLTKPFRAKRAEQASEASRLTARLLPVSDVITIFADLRFFGKAKSANIVLSCFPFPLRQNEHAVRPNAQRAAVCQIVVFAGNGRNIRHIMPGKAGMVRL
jgi:hypothetical protein